MLLNLLNLKNEFINHVSSIEASKSFLLEESDKWFLEDFPLTGVRSDAKVAAWKIYRTQLRDWPAAESDLSNATVPTKPPI